jgi:hypothetical protein
MPRVLAIPVIVLRAIVLSATGYLLVTFSAPRAQSAVLPAVLPITVHSAGRVTQCGTERWSVKTGMDMDARRVDLHPVTTSIYHLRSLRAPSTLPALTRISPVEYHTYTVQAAILRTKLEADSDYHIVIADTGGRTMIAEIPSTACIGNGSPFRSRIAGVRSNFAARFHPEASHWAYPNVRVTITGVGFFDFKHGQSGVAPNAIELHPVLSIHYGWSSSGATSLPPTRKPTPHTQTSRSFHMTISVSPNPMPYDAYPILTAHTAPGARCTAEVTYSTGRTPVPFDGSSHVVGTSGTTQWSWHEETSGTGGTASVTCKRPGFSTTLVAAFTVTH